MGYDSYLYSLVEGEVLEYQKDFDAFMEAQEKQFKTQIRFNQKENNQDGK